MVAKASDNAFPSILITEGTEPSAPAAGKQRLYIDSTSHKLKRTDSSGVDVTIESSGLTFTNVSPEEVVLNSTTAISVARTLTPAISAVPSNAVLATGYIQINVNAAVNNSNWFAVFHANNDGEEASIARSGLGSGITMDQPFSCKVQQSSGSKLYYQISRAAGTITYVMTVTGYWAPA